jgi:3-dehydroquinate synthase
MKIKSHLKTYSVEFIDNFNSKLVEIYKKGDVVFIDKNVPYSPLQGIDYIEVVINENSKEYNNVGKLIEKLPSTFNKSNKIIAVGGGITQDIVTFISAILFRGINWVFFPTTLLAQGDSCLGGKASINLNRTKNKLGLFNPPNEIYIDLSFTKTLPDKDVLSGLGEMLHFYLVAGLKDFEFFKLNINNLQRLIKRCLEIKKYYIEKDEFDKGVRLLLNYGHTFGHAIEGATNYKYPHGIAVSKGMDIANFISYKLGYINKDLYMDIKKILKTFFKDLRMPKTLDIIKYLKQDKKNTNHQLTCILTKGPGDMFITKLNYNRIIHLLNEYE